MTSAQRLSGGGNGGVKRAISIVTVLVLVAVGILCVIGWKAGIFTSQEKLNAFVSGMGVWAPLVFILIQVVQIIIPVIPGAIACSVGVIVFGPVYGFLYNYLGIVLGSFIAFLLARWFGQPLIRAIVPEKTYDKYIGWLDREQKRFDRLFAIGIFLPCSPDDFLCMLAGVSKMPTRRFLLILIALKPAFLIPYSLGIPSLLALL